MNARERFLRTMHFETPDRVPYWEVIGYWNETLWRWQDEGMPADVHVNAYFGMDRRQGVPVNNGLVPLFREEIISEDADTVTTRDATGVVAQRLKSGQCIPHYIEFPLKGRSNWAEFKKRLNPDSPCRYPEYWDDYKRSVKDRDYPLGISPGSLFGWLRNWMGIEHIAVAFYDDPDFIHEAMEHITEFTCKLLERALVEIGDIEFAFFWEDMAYKTGSLISPRMFKEFMVPRYQRITSLLRKHGVSVIGVDCDGFIDELIPLWLEGGLNCVYPLEVAPGEDIVALRKQYGEDLLMIGGLDKRVLAKDKVAVKTEVMAKVPFMIESGGWIPSMDHCVPPDVPLENYLYYLDLLHEIVEG